MYSKYSPLRTYLENSGMDRVELSFKEIEDILGSKLPSSAYSYRAWWANDLSHTHARNGWLAAGYMVSTVDLVGKRVVFLKKEVHDLNNLNPVDRSDADHDLWGNISRSVRKASEFEELARRVMSGYFKTRLEKRRKEGWPKEFDLVSPDYGIVGDAKYYSMVRGKNLPPAKFATIAEHVWMLESIDADIKFLVFGNDRRVPLEWIKRYGYMVKTVKFYFIDENGEVEELL